MCPPISDGDLQSAVFGPSSLCTSTSDERGDLRARFQADSPRLRVRMRRTSPDERPCSDSPHDAFLPCYVLLRSLPPLVCGGRDRAVDGHPSAGEPLPDPVFDASRGQRSATKYDPDCRHAVVAPAVDASAAARRPDGAHRTRTCDEQPPRPPPHARLAGVVRLPARRRIHRRREARDSTNVCRQPGSRQPGPRQHGDVRRADATGFDRQDADGARIVSTFRRCRRARNPAPARHDGFSSVTRHAGLRSVSREARLLFGAAAVG